MYALCLILYQIVHRVGERKGLRAEGRDVGMEITGIEKNPDHAEDAPFEQMEEQVLLCYSCRSDEQRRDGSAGGQEWRRKEEEAERRHSLRAQVVQELGLIRSAQKILFPTES